MSLKKRGNTWWISFTTPSGKRIRRSTGTSDQKEAEELHDKLKAESWRIDKLGERPSYTWDDAGLRWLDETQHKRTHKEDILKLAWMQQFLRGRSLAEITREEIAAIGEKKRKAASAATANRFLALIRAILRRACADWEWIDKVPKVRMYPEAKRRVRWLKPEEVGRLIQELPVHQQDVVLFALATGLRQSNIRELSWQQVDLVQRTAWIPDEEAKNGEDIHVSLSQFAVEILQRQMGKHPEAVFTYDGRRVGQLNTTGWRSALKRAGIENFRWHDLRHTWASWLVQSGTPLYALQEMGGWKSTEMIRRYAHLAPAHLAKHADVVGNMLIGTNVAQSANPDAKGRQ